MTNTTTAPALKTLIGSGAATLALLAAGPAAGASLVGLNFSGTTASGSVTLTVDTDPFAGQPDGNPPGAMAITAASGTFTSTAPGIGNAAITGLLALNFAAAPAGEKLLKNYSFHPYDAVADPTKGFSYDNLFYPAGSPLVCLDDQGNPLYPFAGGSLDIFGAMFTLDNGNLLGLWSNGVVPGAGLNYGYNLIHPSSSGFELLDSQAEGVVAAPVPEPGTLALFSVGLLGVFAWRRKEQAQPALG